MLFGPTAASTRYHRVETDLGDVLGTPGIDAPARLIDDLQRATDCPWSQLVDNDGLFLTCVLEVPPTEPHEGSPATPSGVARTAVDVVLPPARAARTAGAGEPVVAVLQSATGRHEVHQQLLRGAPVLGGTYRLHYGAQSVTLTGRPLGDLAERDPGPWPGVADAEVRRSMREALDLPASAGIELERVVFPTEGRGVWAVKGECVLQDPPADLRIVVRVDDLALLLSYDIACSALFGEASVYPVSPSRTPETVQTLLAALGPQPPDRLRGALFDVGPVRGDGMVSSTRDFRCKPEDPGFDEVSVYAHLQAGARWFAAVLGDELFTEAPFNPLRVFTGDRTVGTSVAMFFPSTGQMRFAGGPRPGTRSADIVFHELTHAITDRICRLNRSASASAKALSEGFADYAAASALDDPRFGDYVLDRPQGARNCADASLRFPEAFDDNDRYDVGAVWAAVLWDIRADVGAAITDSLALHSLYYLTPLSTLEEARAALVKTDRDLFPDADGRGRHEDAINARYDARRA